MGWASYVDDLTESLEDGLSRLSAAAADPSTVSADLPRQLLMWRPRAEQLLRELRHYTELATDPTLDLAHELVTQQGRVQTLERRLDAANAQSTRLVQERDAAHRDLQEAKDNLKQKERELQALRAEFERRLGQMLQQDPGAVYDSYSLEDLQNKYKSRR